MAELGELEVLSRAMVSEDEVSWLGPTILWSYVCLFDESTMTEKQRLLVEEQTRRYR